MIPVPLVSVRNCERNPIRPRAGMRNSIRTRPLPWFTIFVIVPRRVPTWAMTTPWNSSATSTTRSSTGSTVWPLTSLVTMSGRDTWSSKPSRRIISIRIESWSSPRPSTFICSGVSVASTRIETLPSSSLSRRSLICREVTNWPSRPAIGEVLTPKIIDTVGSSTAIGVSALRSTHVGDGFADGDVLDAGEADDVAGGGVGDVDAAQALEGEELRHLRLLHPAVELADRNRIADFDPAVEHAPDGDASQVVAGVEVGHEHLQRRLGIAPRRRHAVDDDVEERPQILARLVHFHARRPGPGAGVDDGEVDLLVVGVEIDEEVVDLVEDFLRPRVRPIDLVDDDDRRQPPLERLAQDEPGLGQRPLGSVDEQQHAIDHRQGPLDLTAEIGVAGSVDDVDQGVVVVDRRILGQNRNAALALEVGIVHRPLGDALVGPEDSALVEHGIDERGLAVVDVRDDGDVPAQRIGDARAGF